MPTWARLDLARAVVLTAWAATVLPRLLQSLLAPKYRTPLGTPSVPDATLSLLADRFLGLGLVTLCALTVVVRLRNLPHDRGWVLLAFLAPWIFTVGRELYLSGSPRIDWAVYPAIVVALWVLRPERSALRLLGGLVSATAVVSLMLAVVLPDKGVYRLASGELIAPEKQILPWGVLIGPFSHGNELGQFLALGLPAVLLMRRGWPRVGAIVLVSAALVWTSARSSLAAVVVALVLAAVFSLVGNRTRRTAAGLLIFGLGSLLLVLPWVTDDTEAFTNRGLIWAASLQGWSESPVVGLGTTWYAGIAQYSGGIAGSAFHGHNQGVQFLVTGGVVGLSLAVLLMLVVVRRAVAQAGMGSTYAVIFLVVFIISGTLEVEFGFIDRALTIPVTLVPLCIIALGRQDQGTADDDSPTEVGKAAGIAQPRDGRRYSVYT